MGRNVENPCGSNAGFSGKKTEEIGRDTGKHIITWIVLEADKEKTEKITSVFRNLFLLSDSLHPESSRQSQASNYSLLLSKTNFPHLV
jgi:hypothetical protein